MVTSAVPSARKTTSAPSAYRQVPEICEGRASWTGPWPACAGAPQPVRVSRAMATIPYVSRSRTTVWPVLRLLFFGM